MLVDNFRLRDRDKNLLCSDNRVRVDLYWDGKSVKNMEDV